MAEFALGLTKTAVAGTLSRVKSAIEEEAAVKKRVQEDLEFITGEFQMMQSFIRGANAADRAAKNQVVRTWVKQLRDLAFDVEDCVEFILHLDSPRWTNCLWRVVPSCCKAGAPPLPMDEAVAEIKRLKTRVVDVSQRNTRYNLMVDSTAMADQPIMLPPPTTTTASSSSAAAFRVLNEVWQAAGKLHSTGTTLKDLTSAEGNELQVVSLWPGSHTTGSELHRSELSCIIREAYNAPEIHNKFECRAWVKLTSAFNPEELLNSLIAQFFASFSTSQIAAADSKTELMHQVSTKRYLLVIQGISTVDELDAIKMYLPDNNTGSRIIVTVQQLRTALLCTGDPYKVSELARFSDGPLLCAFSKAFVLYRDTGEYIWQIRHGGVISVLGDLSDNPEDPAQHAIYRLYKFLMYKHKDLDGVLVFKEQSWVDVPNPFDLQAFFVQLFLNFQTCDFEAKEITAVGLEGVAERCRKYLVEGDCLVVINGLQSKEHWDMIKETFLLSGEPMATDTSIVVITKKASVAAHCANQQNRCLDMKDVEADVVLSRFIPDNFVFGVGKEDSRRAHLSFHDPNDAYHWKEYFKLIGRENEVSSLQRQIKKSGIISVWGHRGAGKSVIARSVYYKQMRIREWGRDEKAEVFTAFSWVDVPNRPFDLTDFSWHLLLNFYSDDVNASVHEGFEMLRGQNPVEDCCEILRQEKCLVVIDGLRSERDWDTIKDTFLSSGPATLQGCIIVVTNKQRVARHCAEARVINVKRLEVLCRPPTKGPPGRTHERREAECSWATEFNLVGRRREKEILFNTMRCYSCLFSVWGVAGVGKSALVRDTYHRILTMLTERNTSIQHSWVDVPDPFDLNEFSQRLLLGFHSDDLQAKENAAVSIIAGHDTVHESCKIMRENSCLIVIDGLKTTHDWDLIRAAFLPDTNERHRIIVISNEESVAMHCLQYDWEVLNVGGLNATDALHLFRKIVWRGKEQLTCDEKEFSESILAMCGGLPEVIAAIGEYSADNMTWIPRNDRTLRSISHDIHHEFMGMLETAPRFQSLKGLICWMQSYFDACPDSLKPCIFYLSVFSLGHNIRKRRLLRRWIAEGYSTEDNGEMLFAELVNSNIIQQQQQTQGNNRNIRKKIVIQVNGFYYGYISSRPMEDNLVFALEEHCTVNSPRSGQHLTIRSSWDRDKVVYESIDFTRLRSLTVFGEWMPFFISPNINMRLLRVLDLEDTTLGVTDDVLKQIGKQLPRLKFISLRGCKEITRIPDSFGGLRQLQTLDMKNTNIVTLPHAINKLVKLQYLRAGTTHEPVDEGVDAALPASHEDDCTSTTSEDRPKSTEDSDDDDTVAGVAKETSTRQLAAEDGNGTSGSHPAIPEGDETSRTQPAATTDQPAGDSEGTSPSESAAHGDGTCQPIAATDSYDTSINQQPTAPGSRGMLTSQPTTAEDDGASQPAVAEADCDETREPPQAAAGLGISTKQAVAAGDDTIRREPTIADTSDISQPAATTTCGNDASQAPVAAKNYDGTRRGQPVADENRASTKRAAWRNKAHDAVVSYYRSWLSMKKSHDNKRNDGIEIPAAALGKLTALHTLGVINLSGARGKAVHKELNKLTQLRKLRVSGINRKNLLDLCCAISGHSHLESFSVRLDKDEDAASLFCSSDDLLSSLPKTLKSLKLYTWGGHETLQVPPGWINQCGSLTKINFMLKMSTQEDIDNLLKLQNKDIFRLMCVKPNKDGELRYGWWGNVWLVDGIITPILRKYFTAPVLNIDCGFYNSVIVFGPVLPELIEVVVVICSSTESSLELSGLENLRKLKEVTLKGSYSEAVKQHLQQQVDRHANKPVLKLEDGESHQSPEPEGPAAPCACSHASASCCFNSIISTCK